MTHAYLARRLALVDGQPIRAQLARQLPRQP